MNLRMAIFAQLLSTGKWRALGYIKANAGSPHAVK
jgi:hypothetical protein